jgi:hypothetical protein
MTKIRGSGGVRRGGLGGSELGVLGGSLGGCGKQGSEWGPGGPALFDKMFLSLPGDVIFAP